MTSTANFLLPMVVPLAHLAAAALSRRTYHPATSFWCSSVALGAAILSAVILLTQRQPAEGLHLLSAAPASVLMTLLVAVLGLVITGFSRNYMAGDERQARFASMLHLTLAAVATVVTTDQLFVLLLAWLGVSLALNELLLFYPDRPRAVLAAHKKFLFARGAELALLVAFMLLYATHGTAQISAILAAYPAELTLQEQIATCLIALAAIIKCAQMPMHGWLIQVVESPTPVSALLHAGVVNLGGYLLILFAPLLTASAPASALIMFIAGLTVVLASLIMTTRSTIKVKLAWSTIAQMGMMLLQCALGLYELAMLHLLAHACYKAYLFLRAGSAAHQHVEQGLAASGEGTGLSSWLFSIAIAGAGIILAAQFFAPGGPVSPWLLLAAFLTVGLVEQDSINRGRLRATAGSFAIVLLLAYVAQKQLMHGFLGIDATSALGTAGDLWLLGLGAMLIAGGLYLRERSQSPVRRVVREWLYAGMFLDEWVTRKTLQIWPLRLPIHLPAKSRRSTLWEGK